jgi:hypothetical protein
MRKSEIEWRTKCEVPVMSVASADDATFKEENCGSLIHIVVICTLGILHQVLIQLEDFETISIISRFAMQSTSRSSRNHSACFVVMSSCQRHQKDFVSVPHGWMNQVSRIS